MEEKTKPISTKANVAQKTIAVCAVGVLILTLVDLFIKISAVAAIVEKGKQFIAPFQSMMNLGGQTEQKEN